MERRLILVDVKKKATLVGGVTSGLGLATSGALSAQGLNVAQLVSGPGHGLTEVGEMARQVRLLSATIDSVLRQAE
jgi:hypothetical protein